MPEESECVNENMSMSTNENNNINVVDDFVETPEDRLKTMKREELKEELRIRRQTLSGTKAELLN